MHSNIPQSFRHWSDHTDVSVDETAETIAHRKRNQ